MSANPLQTHRKQIFDSILKAIGDDGIDAVKLLSKICYSIGISENSARELIRVLWNSDKIRLDETTLRWYKV